MAITVSSCDGWAELGLDSEQLMFKIVGRRFQN